MTREPRASQTEYDASNERWVDDPSEVPMPSYERVSQMLRLLQTGRCIPLPECCRRM